MRVASKQQSYALWQQGAFGNKLRTWDSLTEILASGYAGTVSMRYKGSAGGSFYAYEVALANIPELQRQWVSQGARPELITFNESAPDACLLIQGELMRYPGYVLTYSCEKAKMREAMKHPKHAQGLTAKFLLQQFCAPSSFDDLMELLDLYPDHVIEFGAYEQGLGNRAGRNTIIWEVRDY